jgi:rod shape-determining protein MreC
VLKFKKKNLIYLAISCFLILSLAFLTPASKVTFLNTLKQPLNLLTLARREVGAIIFYHRNFIESQRLKREIDLLRQKLNSLNEVYLENIRLQKLLSLKQKSAYKVIAAGIIARSPDSWSSIIIIDKGSNNGIKRGMTAINYLGLLGRVIETTAFTSKIMLINDPNLSISGIVQRSRQEGLVSGTLGNHLIMRYLSEESDIKIQDVIVSSGLNEIYPKGLLIGRVVDIGKEFSGLSRYALIKPAVNLSNIEEVLIIVP